MASTDTTIAPGVQSDPMRRPTITIEYEPLAAANPGIILTHVTAALPGAPGHDTVKVTISSVSSDGEVTLWIQGEEISLVPADYRRLLAVLASAIDHAERFGVIDPEDVADA